MSTKPSNLASPAFRLNLAEVMRRVGAHVKRTPRIRWDTDVKGGQRAWLEVQDPPARTGHTWRRLASLTLRMSVAGLTYAVEAPDVLVAGRGIQDHGEALRKLQATAFQAWKHPAPASPAAQDLEPEEPLCADLSKLLDDPEARGAVLTSHLVEKHTGARPSHDAALLLARAALPVAEMLALLLGHSACPEPKREALIEQVLAAMLESGLAAARTG